MKIFVFADERKNVIARWDYICLLIIPSDKFKSLFNDLIKARQEAQYDYELSFSKLNKKGTGSKLDLANCWTDIIIDDATKHMDRIYFKIFGIDKAKLDFSFFGYKNTPDGKYANIYNRFFRTALLGSLNYFFPDKPITVQRIFHDTEGNLQNHDYFDWHCIKKISDLNKRISFSCDRVIFVDSNHFKEKQFPTASHIIQLTDLIIGSVTYCIHETNLSNKSQYEIARKMLPLVNGILSNPYDKNSSLGYYRKYDICHFPKNRLKRLHEKRIPGECYRLNCESFLDRVTGQQYLDLK